MKRHLLLLSLLTGIIFIGCHAQRKVPKVYSNMGIENGKLYLERNNARVPNIDIPPYYTLQQMLGDPMGTQQGIAFNFQDSLLTGTLYYGLIHYNDSRHPLPVFFRSKDDKFRVAFSCLTYLTGCEIISLFKT